MATLRSPVRSSLSALPCMRMRRQHVRAHHVRGLEALDAEVLVAGLVAAAELVARAAVVEVVEVAPRALVHSDDILLVFEWYLPLF